MPEKELLIANLQFMFDNEYFEIDEYKQEQRNSIWIKLKEGYCLSVIIYKFGFWPKDYCYETLLIEPHDTEVEGRILKKKWGYENDDIIRFTKISELDSKVQTLKEQIEEEFKCHHPDLDKEIPDFEIDPEVECGVCYENIKTYETSCCKQRLCTKCLVQIDCCPFCREEPLYALIKPAFIIS
jgi:hypothetical protein